MNILPKKKIVFLGMMTKIPVAGAVWGTIHYLVGLERLGYEVYYVEAHARTPSMFMETEEDDGSGKAAAFIQKIMERFGLGDRWAFHALHEDGRCYGMSQSQLKELYGSAALLINYHGGTVPTAEHTATGRLIYLETDPVDLEIEIYHNIKESIDFLAQHIAIFTWGLNYNNPDCLVPLSERFSLSTAAACRRHRSLARRSQPRRTELHDGRKLEADVARDQVQERDLPLEQALRVLEVH